VQKDVMKLREVMSRVINFSTMGVDMSKLFTPVIMVGFHWTSDG
jgi:singapore isolate B (sub-type 7) whole genome shotgun sequence assembly, scaffold_2